MMTGKLKMTSRVRLARNLQKYDFPHRLDVTAGRRLVEEVEAAFFVGPALKKDFVSKRLWEEQGLDLLAWFERHLVSTKLLDHAPMAAFIADRSGQTSLMINEEDHLRLQTMSRDKSLEELWEEADRLDSLLEERLDWAFDMQLGYLTACPTNLGTALRASVMVHLPALMAQDKIGLVAQKLAQMGMTIRGIYGEGSQAQGNIFQISNEVTLGISEPYILRNIEETIEGILAMEAEEQHRLLSRNTLATEDACFRSLGILGHARSISSQEALSHLSNLRMGIELDLIKDWPTKDLDDLIVRIQPGNLHRQLGLEELMAEEDRDQLRATILRQAMKRRLTTC